jgi:hypothetical protein
MLFEEPYQFWRQQGPHLDLALLAWTIVRGEG